MRQALILVFLFSTATAQAATRLTYSMNGKPTPIHWSSSDFPISYHVVRDVPARLPQAELMIARAFSGWQTVSESSVRFRDAGPIDAAAGKDGKNAITVSDRLFADSGFIAYTTNWFEDDGRILESDIQIDANAATNGSNLEALIQHEIGHFLGLDHSAIVSSVMFPYIGSEDLGGLDSDDRIAISAMYPRQAMSEWGAVLRGEVREASGGVFGAQVVAVSAGGSPLASVLTDRTGKFELSGIPEGEYTLYAEPLDGPVESRNLSGFWRDGRSGFRTEFLPVAQRVAVRRGEVRENLILDIAGGQAALNPKWIGVFPENSTDIRLGATASKIKAGDTVCVAVGGDGFVSGLTSFEVLNQGFTRVSEFRYGPNYLWATFRVAPETPAGSTVIRVANGDEATALTGALRVERAGRRRLVRG